MAAAAITAAMNSAETTSSEIGRSLSGIFGCVSMVAWICLLVRFLVCSQLVVCYVIDNPPQLPQLIANYKAQSADALSMGFLIIWMLGDLANLGGV